MQVCYVEAALIDHPRVTAWLQRYPKAKVIECEHYGEVFNRKSQHFRAQKQAPAWILAEKRGQRVLPTPEHFGIGGQENYYFSHFLNCLYDCRYCFLQGMYPSANYTWFVNYEDFQQDIRQLCDSKPRETFYFFSGYDGDSLALEPMTYFAESFLPFFDTLDNAWLELRTKSVQIRSLLQQPVCPRVVVAFSLTPQALSSRLERGVPSVAARIEAMQKLAEQGWWIGLRFDPLIDCVDFEKHYAALFDAVFAAVPLEQVHSVSLGPMRFPQKMFQKIAQMYPDEPLFSQPLVQQKGQVTYAVDREQVMQEWVRAQLGEYVEIEKLFTCHAL